MAEDISMTDKVILQRITFCLEDASINIKACNLKEAVSVVSNANDMARILFEESPTTDYFRQIKKCVSHINSVLMITASSQNAADSASRIAGMLDILVMMLRG